MNIHIRLREERKRLGLTLAQMAERGGINPRSYSHYEKGERMPDAAFLAKVAEPVDVDELSRVDVFYVLTGQTIASKQQPAPLTEAGIEAIVKYKLQAGQDVRPYGLSDDENVLIERYRRSTPDVRAAALRMLSSPTEPPLIKPPKRLTERDSDLPEKRFKKPAIRGGS